MYTYDIEKAIQAACVLHAGQVRKGEAAIPYVSHVFSVFQILQDYTNHEPTLVAALLHDTLEDTEYSPAALEEDFGTEVLEIVASVTEQQGVVDWADRKKRYLQSLEEGSESALLIAAADKIHNIRSMIEQYHSDVEGFIAQFDRYRTKGLAFYESLGELLNEELESAIVDEYLHVLSEFKIFLEHVEENTVEN